MPWIDDPHPESDHPDRYWLPDVIPEKNETLDKLQKISKTRWGSNSTPPMGF